MVVMMQAVEHRFRGHTPIDGFARCERLNRCSQLGRRRSALPHRGGDVPTEPLVRAMLVEGKTTLAPSPKNPIIVA